MCATQKYRQLTLPVKWTLEKQGKKVCKTYCGPEVLEGSSDEDEVEDETFGRIFRGRGQDEKRIFSLFLGLFEYETRNSSEFWPFSQPF